MIIKRRKDLYNYKTFKNWKISNFLVVNNLITRPGVLISLAVKVHIYDRHIP